METDFLTALRGDLAQALERIDAELARRETARRAVKKAESKKSNLCVKYISAKDYQELVMKTSGWMPHLEIESVEYICKITISDTETTVEKGD